MAVDDEGPNSKSRKVEVQGKKGDDAIISVGMPEVAEE
jgi:hypothetical protein